MTVLSIVIPTIPSRTALLSRLLHGLAEQTDSRCEVLIVDGEGQLGDKVNAGLAAARGRLSVIVDDDDELAADYVTTVCGEAMAHRHVDPPEYIGYRIQNLVDGRWVSSIGHRLDGDQSWCSEPRGVGPKCPFLTAVGREVPFENDYHADRRWSAAVAERLQRGAFIDRHMYRYDFRSSGSEFIGSGGRVEVGTWPFDRSRFRWLSEE